MRDLHNSIKRLVAIAPQAVGTTGAANGVLSGIIDRKGYDAVEFVYSSGTSAATGDTITPVVLEADATGDSFTSVADTNLVGTEAAITLTAAAAKNVGYIGGKRYLKLRLYGVGTATAIVGATVDLGRPSRQPVA